MKNVRHFLFAAVFAAIALNAQTTFPSPFINAAAPPPANAVATVNGTPGISQYMYVVVAHYPSGDAVSNVLVVNNGNATLDSTNKVVISWPVVPNALTYDVLRVTSNPFTYASCTCALSASATSALTLSDTGAALNVYTAGSLAASSVAYWNVDVSLHDAPQMRTHVSGTSYQANEPRGATLPTYCAVGDHFFKTNATAGQNEYLCAAANTWTQLTGAGSAQEIASGSSALGTSLIASATCATAVTGSATGAIATDNIVADFSGDPTGITGYIPSTSGMLTIIKYMTVSPSLVNFKVCNNTASDVTPGAVTLNWRVIR